MSKHRSLAQAARAELFQETLKRAPWHVRFLLAHPRLRKLMPGFVTRRPSEAIQRAAIDAERELPRRYRRALRREAMLPAKGSR